MVDRKPKPKRYAPDPGYTAFSPARGVMLALMLSVLWTVAYGIYLMVAA